MQPRHTLRDLDAIRNLPLPSDPESETALLSAIILDPTNLDKVADLVSGDDFLDLDSGRLFDGLRTLHDAGIPLYDMRVVLPELKKLNLPESARTPALIAGLYDRGIPSHSTHYAQQVRRASNLRRQYIVAANMIDEVVSPAANPADIAARTIAELTTLGERLSSPSRRLDELTGELLAELRDADRTRMRGTMTGLLSLDELAGGWQPGELIILAARPGVGKTALALQVALHNATRKRPVLFVSLEMTDRELAARILCGRSRVDSRLLRGGGLDAKHLSSIERTNTQIADLPLRIWAPPTATVRQIGAMGKRDAVAHGLALLVVDYIGLVQPDDGTRPRHEQVAATSAGLKRLAKEVDIPVLALCQLNREADRTTPRLAHLRESGAIEQDADLVLFLHRNEEDKTQAALDVAKHRHGETGGIALTWLPEETRFDDAAF